MSSASPITETTLFLYSAITSTKSKIDFVAVGAALNLQSGTAAMRYRRLTERIKKANNPQPPASAKAGVDENSLFLYQCMVASKCKPDWSVVAIATGLKTGTAAMRWRRLHDKIQKEHGSSVASQGGPITSQPAPTAARVRKATPTKKRKATPAKDESEEEVAAESTSDSEVHHKRIRTEGEEALPDKRQTRGKKLDFKGMADSSSSEVGTDQTGFGTSAYTDSSVRVEDDESMMSEEAEKRKLATHPVATPKKGTPVVEKAKATNANDPITPVSAAHSFSQNPKPTPSSTTPTQRQRAVPPPLTPVSGVIIRSIESGDQNEMAQLDGMSDDRFIRSKQSSRVSSKSTRSSEYYEADSEGPSTSASIATSLQAQAPTESDFLDADDIESVAPDDSISMAGKATQGGIKRMRKVENKKEGILGKLWGLFG